ncbi:MAG: ThuA domain-containing protein [Cyclobacteriaceae bacterium]|nr:ThuA domain-containing protein [Cyclobacteriaceae bacterium]
MKKYIILGGFLLWVGGKALAQNASLEAFAPDEAWKKTIAGLAPMSVPVQVSKPHKILLFSLFTGFDHWVIPHANAVVEILGQKTGAFEVVQSTDIGMFETARLKEFDAIVLNNNCSRGDRRDLFYDALANHADLSEQARIEKAAQLEKNLLRFVKKGGGLAVLHGGIVMQNNSPEFSKW